MNQDEIQKSASVAKQVISDAELALINRQSLKTLTADEVYVFKVAACNNIVDRDFERFTDAALSKLAELFVGKTMISDHNWKAALQSARIYAGSVEPMKEGSGKQLELRAYMLKNEATQPTIDAIEGGILREVSIGCRISKAICGICGVDKRKTACPHWPGNVYEGTLCHVDLDAPTDAYEMSFVAVPAQPAAGITKNYGGKEPGAPEAGQEDTVNKNKLRVRAFTARLKAMSIEMEDKKA